MDAVLQKMLRKECQLTTVNLPSSSTAVAVARRLQKHEPKLSQQSATPLTVLIFIAAARKMDVNKIMGSTLTQP